MKGGAGDRKVLSSEWKVLVLCSSLFCLYTGKPFLLADMRYSSSKSLAPFEHSF